jgi:hypothetical protein
VYGTTDSESFRLAKFFDSNDIGCLSSQDFEQIFLPCEDNMLRERVMMRQAPRVSRWDFMPRDIEELMT